MLSRSWGYSVQNLRTNAGTKCVRFSPEQCQPAATALPAWIKQVFSPHLFSLFYTPLSTSIRIIIASVGPPVLPTFHSTYNHHYQFI